MTRVGTKASSASAWRATFERAALIGAGFGFTTATIESMLVAVGKIKIGVAAPETAMISAALASVLIGLALGLIAAPLLRARRGTVAHLALLSVGWVALGLVAGLPEVSLFRVLAVVPFIVAPIVVGATLFVLHRWPERRARFIPIAVLVFILAGSLVVPEAIAAYNEPEPPPAGVAREGAPDVVLVVLDTVRADHVGSYGYVLDTTPTLDAVAAEGARFHDATAPATWSLPSHASLFTGRYVSGHGAHNEHRVLAADAPTLADTLAGAGYDTRCFTANAWINNTLGLTRGFRWTDEAWRNGEIQITRFYAFRLFDRFGFGAQDNGGDRVLSNFEEWASSTPAEGPPTFAFVNLIEAHFPYHQVPRSYLERFTDDDAEALRALSLSLMEAQFGGELPGPEAIEPATAMYDAGIAYVDHLLARLLDALRRRGTLDHTVLIVMSDHGELLGEHGGWGHGHSLLEAETRVPLVIRYPMAIEPEITVLTPVSTVGVYATILELAGVEAPESLQAGSLMTAIRGEAGGAPVLSERFAGGEVDARGQTRLRDPLMSNDVRFRAYRSGDYKLLVTSDGNVRLFDLSRDADEENDVADTNADIARRLRAELSDWERGLGLPALSAESDTAPAPVIDVEARERLRALGYIE